MQPKTHTVRWLSLKAALAGQPPEPEADAEKPEDPRYFNRNLSWLRFNDRVLHEATDTTVPPVERLRFLTIVSSNLDEFFTVRVAQVTRAARTDPAYLYPDGLTPPRLLSLIRQHVIRQKGAQAKALKDVAAVLKKEGIILHMDFPEDAARDARILATLPDIRFLVRPNTEPLPPLESERINVFVRFPGAYAVITIPDRAARLLKLASPADTEEWALIERWLCARAQTLFPGHQVEEAFPFRIIRDADIAYGTDEDTLEDLVVDGVQKRKRAKIIRLEVDAASYSEGAIFLATVLNMDSAALYRSGLPLDLKALEAVVASPKGKRLSYAPMHPVYPRRWARTKNVFDLITRRDLLLHHPYDAGDNVVKFLEQAAADPAVTDIYHTLYRTSRASPVMEALKLAAKNGKRVTVYIEIKARFDELNNVYWAQTLKAAGVRVARPLAGFKVHCKMTLVTRRENGEDAAYLHLGTGNYHPRTARQYTDIGLLTRDPVMGREALAFFSTLARRKEPENLTKLLVAPGNLHDAVIRMIREETDIQRQGGKGRIIAKMNSLVDTDVIEALYDASQAGVAVDLIVRGICCLRPGVKGLSERIRVISVVDRFLEHSRIFYFRRGGEEAVHLSSADWMPRNFHDRYEIAFPVTDPALKSFLRDTVLATYLSDNLRAWRLGPGGDYVRITPSPKEELVRSQLAFEVLARHEYRDTVLAHRAG